MRTLQRFAASGMRPSGRPLRADSERPRSDSPRFLPSRVSPRVSRPAIIRRQTCRGISLGHGSGHWIQPVQTPLRRRSAAPIGVAAQPPFTDLGLSVSPHGRAGPEADPAAPPTLLSAPCPRGRGSTVWKGRSSSLRPLHTGLTSVRERVWRGPAAHPRRVRLTHLPWVIRSPRKPVFHEGN
jgi:hypothetical protein